MLDECIALFATVETGSADLHGTPIAAILLRSKQPWTARADLPLANSFYHGGVYM